MLVLMYIPFYTLVFTRCHDAIFAIHNSDRVRDSRFVPFGGKPRSGKMTQQFYESLPSYEELTVPELHLTWPELKAGSLYFGRFCDEPCKVCYDP